MTSYFYSSREYLLDNFFSDDLIPGAVCKDKAVVEKGEVKVRPVLSVGVTFDHRLIDGVHAAQMSDEFKKCFAEPAKYFGGTVEAGGA